ncbi:MAG: glycosyltransferase family 39 protein [Mediterranea sp.]|jgi:4-amino-4-deoxy-L-arabinose transferase-like glycosyltransferase|nr:glycosyltransferase family 39 protein [Mediterranea sp.]
MRQALSSISDRNLFIVVLLIATLSTLPWIGLGEYYTKGEPREASVAISMLDEGNWILPCVYADEIAYKPPFMHWMMALCSMPGGEVTPFTSRLPSAIAFIVMVGCCFGFFRRLMGKGESLAAILVFISCFEIHRSAMTSRVDMVLTAFIVCGLIGLFYWAEDKRLKGLPWHIPLLLGGAALTKGPVGIVLPLFVFGVYLLLTRRRFMTVVRKCVFAGILSLIPLLVWYYAAYLQEGQAFLDLVWGENVGRFFGSDNARLHYDLGHEHPFWYNFILLALGFMPWTLFLFFSLVAVKFVYKRPGNLWGDIMLLERGKLFSLVSLCLIVFFYCIPMSKRGTYLMPAYPFIAVFLGQYMYSFVTRHTKVNYAFGVFWGVVTGVVALLSVSALLGWVDLQDVAAGFIRKDRTLFHVNLIGEALSAPTVVYVIVLAALLAVSGMLAVQLRKRDQHGVLYAVFGVWLVCNVLMDGVVLPVFKDGTSIKPFITETGRKYPLKKGNMYVVNDLRKYANLYGANFYLRNGFMSFEDERPEAGYFFSTDKDIEKVRDTYRDYWFELLEESPNRFNDTKAVVQLYRFGKAGQE